MKIQYLDAHKSEVYLSFLILWSYLWGAYRYVQVKFTSVQFDSDAVGVWRPFARAVLNGATPYTSTVWDNKPPFFQVLNIISEASGRYFIVMILLVATANAVIVFLLYEIWKKEDGPNIALLIGALYLSALSYTGTNINSKTFAILFVLLALFSRSLQGMGRGVLMSTAMLFAQQIVFAAPVVLWLAIKRSSESLRLTVAKFAIGGLSTAAVAYGSLAIIYNPNTMFRALYYTNGIITRYFTREGGKHIFADPVGWLVAFLSAFDNLALILIAAVYGTYMTISSNQISLKIINGEVSQHRVGAIMLLISISLIPALLLRAEPVYWIMFFPSLAGLAGVGIKSLVAGSAEARRDIPR